MSPATTSPVGSLSLDDPERRARSRSRVGLLVDRGEVGARGIEDAGVRHGRRRPPAVTVTSNENVEVPGRDRHAAPASPCRRRACTRGRSCRRTSVPAGTTSLTSAVNAAPGLRRSTACRSACPRARPRSAETDLTIVGFTSSSFVTVLLSAGVGVSVEVDARRVRDRVRRVGDGSVVLVLTVNETVAVSPGASVPIVQRDRAGRPRRRRSRPCSSRSRCSPAPWSLTTTFVAVPDAGVLDDHRVRDRIARQERRARAGRVRLDDRQDRRADEGLDGRRARRLSARRQQAPGRRSGSGRRRAPSR